MRPQITSIYIAGVKRLQQDYDINAFCIVSPDDKSGNKELLKEAGFYLFEYKNNPLGEKKNRGLKEAVKLDFSYLIELGSDDVLLSEMMEHYKDEPYQGLKDFAMFDLQTGKAKHLHRHTLYGIGRMYTKDILKWYLWDDRENRGMDNHADWVLLHKGIRPTIHEFDDPMAIDFKSKVNIWPYDKTPKGKEIDEQELFKNLSGSEIKAIRRASSY